MDRYTICRAIDGLDGVTVVLMGDLANSGTGRSLCYFLAKYSGVKLCLVSQKELAMRDDIVDCLGRNRAGFKLIHSPGAELEEALRKAFRIDRKMLDLMGPRVIIMPLPRIDSITPDVDKDPRAHYFQQISNGLYIQIALLQMLVAR